MVWQPRNDRKKGYNISFEHTISSRPKAAFCIQKEDIKPNKRSEIQEANHLFFVKNINNLSTVWICIIIWLFLTLIVSLSNNFIVLLFPLPLLGIALWYWALYYFNPPKEIVLNRLEGTISYPKPYFYKTAITVLFSDISAYEKQSKIEIRDEDTLHKPGIRCRYLYFKHLKTKLPILTVDVNDSKEGSPLDRLRQAHSFYTWYMDKNRPLPPGTAFDAYRKKDFDRRRDEGFLDPLYPSSINTPEANSYQQRIYKESLELKSYLKKHKK